MYLLMLIGENSYNLLLLFGLALEKFIVLLFHYGRY